MSLEIYILNGAKLNCISLLGFMDKKSYSSYKVNIVIDTVDAWQYFNKYLKYKNKRKLIDGVIVEPLYNEF